MIVNHIDTPGYEAVPWTVPATREEAGVIHVLATLPEYHHRGFGKQLIAGAIELSREAGLKVLRLDMLTYNWRGRKLYESCRFKLLGTFPLHYQLLGTADLDLFELALQHLFEPALQRFRPQSRVETGNYSRFPPLRSTA